MRKPRILLIAGGLLISALLTSGCALVNNTNEKADTAGGNIVGMANPAAVYCQGLGYSMEKTEREGGEDADCLFPDGTRCAQWDFLSGRCGKTYSYCEINGFDLAEDGNIGTCQFPDGSSCDEYQYFNGACDPGDNPGTAGE